jgi:hypothetical protein
MLSARDQAEINRTRAALALVSALLERACQARTLHQAVDCVIDARQALAGLPARIALLGSEPEPFVCPDPVQAADWTRREAAGQRRE